VAESDLGASQMADVFDRLKAALSDRAAAATNYANALRYWDRGGQEIEEWRVLARDGLSRVVAEHSR
jgi:hypothetical protein